MVRGTVGLFCLPALHHHQARDYELYDILLRTAEVCAFIERLRLVILEPKISPESPRQGADAALERRLQSAGLLEDDAARLELAGEPRRGAEWTWRPVAESMISRSCTARHTAPRRVQGVRSFEATVVR